MQIALLFLLPPPAILGSKRGCISAIDSHGRTIWIADAHRDDGKRFIVHSDKLLTAFPELERAVCIHLLNEQC